MRIGQLTHKVDVFRQIRQQSETGSVSQVRKHICTLRCNLLKQSGRYQQDNIEQADKVNLVFQTWLTEGIFDTDTIEWCAQEFRIYLIEKDVLSRTMKLHVQKIIK